TKLEIKKKIIPPLDSDFTPAILWNKKFKELVKESSNSRPIIISLTRSNGSVSTLKTEIFNENSQTDELNLFYVERLIKFLLWMKGGYKITIAGAPDIAAKIAKIYSKSGKRAFDWNIMGNKIYGSEMQIISTSLDDRPEEKEFDIALGGNTNGCRVGFDLGGSDRKCAALIDGKVIFTEEVKWDPYFQKDPTWHKEGINDSIKRAAKYLPRVDAIGGSAAGVYVNNQVRVASLFRGISEENFQKHIVNLFNELQKEWNVPLVVVNDGEVSALAGAMSMKDNSVLGVSMGTSFAAGYVNPSGRITDWLNELAFAPIDYRENAPIDEWSGDKGCGVQFFSQQAVSRLIPSAGIKLHAEMPMPEKLIEIQNLMNKNDARAKKIYQTIGICFGYAIATYSEFYNIKNLLFLGRVSSGIGGEIIIDEAQNVLKIEFPEIAEKLKIKTPDEQMKRHGQAAAAATLPIIPTKNSKNSINE
ncbi:MAG TPA: ROK family protein, partial [Victivallales bacterium]|nr:ROK family protein [Victivallales bacterium]